LRHFAQALSRPMRRANCQRYVIHAASAALCSGPANAGTDRYEARMRWILTISAVLGFLIALAAHSPGWLAFGVFIGLICGLGAALAFIDLQIQGSSRSEYMTPGELDALKASLKPPPSGGNSGPSLPPPTPQ
jgi:hypothetical protein